MRMQSAARVGPSRFTGLFGTLLLVGATACGAAFAQQAGGPSKSPPGAQVYFVDIKNGDKVPTKFTVHFGLRKMGVAPAGIERENAGHHHLLVDTPLPPLNEAIPSDFNHLHFGAGQTEGEVTLTPGEHTLQLLLGDQNHIPHTPPVMSAQIKIFVDEKMPIAMPAPPPMPRKASPPGARVYFVGIRNGSVLSPTPTIRFGLVNMGVAPAGFEKANTGHHHLLIDTPVPALDQPIPSDFNHLHFGSGQTEAKVTLPLGQHTIQLLLGDENHVPHDPPVMSKPITVLVTATGKRPKSRRDR